MILLDVKPIASSKAEALEGRSVHVFVQSKLALLTGNWLWELHCDSVFCSDVMMVLPSSFEGTKGIIYPDDLARVKEALSDLHHQETINLQFRIITTYGEVKTLKGTGIRAAEGQPVLPPPTDLAEEMNEDKQQQKDVERLYIQKEIAQYAEKILQTGSWYINAATHEVWYSDTVFRIYGLSPQSLNAHFNTFNHFIHPEDSAVVIEAFEKAYYHNVPLHIEYRIVTADGREKNIQQLTRWIYSQKGEPILTGLIQDKSEVVEMEQHFKHTELMLKFQQDVLAQNEENASLGNWHINLLTRKTVYSDNYYRLYGLKPQLVLPSINTFINFVHPDDQASVLEAYRKIRYEHIAPPLEYRIIRPDGSIRHLRQKGKVIMYGNEELIMAGTTQDITHQKELAQKLSSLNQEAAIRTVITEQAEELAELASWRWELKSGKISSSDNLYRFFGLKPQSVPFSKELLLSFINKEDQKLFTSELELTLAGQPATACEVRVTRKGRPGLMKVSFILTGQEDDKLLIGTFVDTSQEYKLENKLAERIQHYELLADTINDKVLITDLNNNIISWSKRCEEGFKWKKAEVINKNFFEVFPYLKTAAYLQNLQKALGGETLFLPHATIPSIKGYHHISMVPLKNKEDQVTGVLHVLHNIEKELELQLGLSERLNFIESLIEASVDRIIVLDRNMNYLYWNKKCEEYYGLTKEEVIGKNILDISPGSNTSDASYKNFRKALKGETVHITAEENLLSGTYQEVYLIPVKDEREEVKAILWVLHDRTSEYELIKQQQKADEILKAVNEAYVELDADFRFIYINPRAEEFWKIKKEDLLNRTVWEVFPEAVDSPLYKDAIKVAVEKIPVKGTYTSSVTGALVNVSIAPTPDGVLLVFYDLQSFK